MNKTWQIPRRTFLKGLGTVIALPMLEAMLPPAKLFAAGATEAGAAFPRRMAFIYIPNGANMEDWTPKSLGADYELPYILQPLEPLKNDLQVVSGLAHDKARPHGDGPGDHARGAATLLNGSQARKSKGAGMNVDVCVE